METQFNTLSIVCRERCESTVPIRDHSARKTIEALFRNQVERLGGTSNKPLGPAFIYTADRKARDLGIRTRCIVRQLEFDRELRRHEAHLLLGTGLLDKGHRPEKRQVRNVDCTDRPDR